MNIILTPKIDISPGWKRMQGTIKMRGIQLLFFPSRKVKFDQYNSFLREVVAMEEALWEMHMRVKQKLIVSWIDEQQKRIPW